MGAAVTQRRTLPTLTTFAGGSINPPRAAAAAAEPYPSPDARWVAANFELPLDLPMSLLQLVRGRETEDDLSTADVVALSLSEAVQRGEQDWLRALAQVGAAAAEPRFQVVISMRTATTRVVERLAHQHTCANPATICLVALTLRLDRA